MIKYLNDSFKKYQRQLIYQKKRFTYNESKLLNKDLNFCPTPEKYNKMNYDYDIQNYIRTIKLKVHFIKNLTSKAQVINGEHQGKHITRLKHL